MIGGIRLREKFEYQILGTYHHLFWHPLIYYSLLLRSTAPGT